MWRECRGLKRAVWGGGTFCVGRGECGVVDRVGLWNVLYEWGSVGCWYVSCVWWSVGCWNVLCVGRHGGLCCLWMAIQIELLYIGLGLIIN
jgi:hypothetical protein